MGGRPPALIRQGCLARPFVFVDTFWNGFFFTTRPSPVYHCFNAVLLVKSKRRKVSVVAGEGGPGPQGMGRTFLIP